MVTVDMLCKHSLQCWWLMFSVRVLLTVILWLSHLWTNINFWMTTKEVGRLVDSFYYCNTTLLLRFVNTFFRISPFCCFFFSMQHSWKWFLYNHCHNVNKKSRVEDDVISKPKMVKTSSTYMHPYPPVPKFADDEESFKRNLQVSSYEYMHNTSIYTSMCVFSAVCWWCRLWYLNTWGGSP